MTIHGTHNEWLVGLSVLVAIAASYTALDLASRIHKSQARARLGWVAASAVAMGGGIWSMHFIAMLAFSMAMPVGYDLVPTLISLALPVLVTGAAFSIVSTRRASLLALVCSGLVMGLSIVVMHYLGMAAMRMPATLSYAPSLVAVSVLIAIGAATIALWLSLKDATFRVRAAAAVVMGIAVSGMHYTAMLAATFTAQHDASQMEAGFSQMNLALGVALITFFILFIGWAAAVYDRRLASTALQNALAESEERLRLATEAAEVGFWDVDVLNNVLIWPSQVKAMFGISANAPVTMSDFFQGLHPDDRRATAEAYEAACDPAIRALYDVEYRTIGKEDGIVRWVAAKGRGMFDEAGRCTRVAQRGRHSQFAPA